METILIDPQTLIVKSDNQDDLLGVVDSVNRKKREHVKNLLAFAAKHRINAKRYKFNRNECYGR